MFRPLAALALFLAAPVLAHAQDEPDDPFLWLEEVEGEQALEWSRARNAETTGALEQVQGFEALEQELLAIYDSDERIAYPSQMGGYWYNLWRDGEHPRGVWRRTTRASYMADGDPEWEVVLDIDALGKAEGESWVWKGSTCLYPEYRRCLISLSRGGADAVVVREFDTVDKAFVEGGFELPEAKGRVGWIDQDTVYVSTDFGEGTMTDSGYPRQTRRWTRGTPHTSAEIVFEGEQSDISVGAYHVSRPGYERDFVYRGVTFYTNQEFLVTKKGLKKIDKPDSANFQIWKDWAFFELRDDWEIDGTTYARGSLLAAPFKKWMKGKRKVTVLFEPSDTTSYQGMSVTRDHVILSTLDNVKDRIEVLTPGKKSWERRELPIGGEGLLRRSAWAVDSVDSNDLFASVSGYTTPSTLLLVDEAQGTGSELASLPSLFDAEGLVVSQHMATSKDGTKVPYFQVAPEGLELDGSTPTLLYGYGGFEVSLRPGYSAGVGRAWLQEGGVYVVANIRGGGEFGPRWHQAALKDKRHRAYEDFAAVGEDLVARKVTSADKLGILGGSNGGLLMGNMLTLYPDHWGAIVCRVPLLDMRRYHLLLAGASWMGEYGDPDDPEQWKFIKTFSPYHNADPDNVEYPPILVTTSTRDDRVHPGHARKLVAKLREGGEDGVLYYENMEGGHGGAADNSQRAHIDALVYTFLWQTLDGDGVEPAVEGAEDGEDGDGE